MCGIPNSLLGGNKYLERVFHKNNCNADFIKRNIYRPSEADETNRNPTSATIVTIPYIKGTPETISADPTALQNPCSPQTYNYVRHLLTNVKNRNDSQNPTTDREQFAKSNAPTATLTRD